MIHTTPRSGWLNKLSTNNTFGTSRWQSRYFVLLDSEMRYYKDEHSVTASKTINLHDISKITLLSTHNRTYCFKLEPTLYYQHHHHSTSKKKFWILECKSEQELESWVKAIEFRLFHLATLQPFSSPEPKRQQPFTISQIMGTSSAGSEEVSRPLKKICPSISRRRGVLLSPVCTLPCLESSLEDMLSSSSSTDSPDILEELEEHGVCKQADKLVTQHAYLLDTGSIYKNRI